MECMQQDLKFFVGIHRPLRCVLLFPDMGQGLSSHPSMRPSTVLEAFQDQSQAAEETLFGRRSPAALLCVWSCLQGPFDPNHSQHFTIYSVFSFLSPLPPLICCIQPQLSQLRGFMDTDHVHHLIS